MNVLSISLDPNIVEPDPARRTNNARERQLAYASRLDAYHAIVLTRDAGRRPAERAADNCWFYPAHGATRLQRYLQAERLASAICRRSAIDVVTTQDPWTTGVIGWRLKRRFGVPLNVQLHVDVLDNHAWLAERALHRGLRFVASGMLRRADTVRVVNETMRRRLIERGLPEQRIRSIPVATPVTEPDGETIARVRRQWLGTAQTHLIVFAGRFTRQKDLATLLDAVPAVAVEHPGVVFLLAGDGPLAVPLQRRVSREAALSRHVRFAGRVPHGQMAAHLAAADVVVLSSVYEGLPQVLVEVAALARPIVATETSGARELLAGGESGWLVPPRHSSCLAERINDMLHDPAQAARMGEAARRRVRDRWLSRDLIGEMVQLLAETR